MKRWCALALGWLLTATLIGCAAQQQETDVPAPTSTAATLVLAAETNASPAETPTPAHTAMPEPTATPRIVTVGAAGDISMTQRQLAAGYDANTQRYCFSEAFTGVATLFSEVDLMCVNLETPLAGRAAGYSGGGANGGGYGSFNAPDALAADLVSAGVDVATTANNHFLDRGTDGVFATLDALDKAGLAHTGTFRSVQARETSPLVLNAGGVKVGIVACTSVFNDVRGYGRYELSYLVSRTIDGELLARDIQACRDAGAAFVIAFAHWDDEYAEAPSEETRKEAAMLLSLGADAVLGAHPHTVQPFEYITVERGGKSYTGLVAYSMGNCLLRMSNLPHNGGLFVRLRLQQDADGTVSLLDAAYLPLAILSTMEDGREYVETIACRRALTHSKRLTDAQSRASETAAYIMKVVGTDIVPLMD